METTDNEVPAETILAEDLSGINTGGVGDLAAGALREGDVSALSQASDEADPAAADVEDGGEWGIQDPDEAAESEPLTQSQLEQQIGELETAYHAECRGVARVCHEANRGFRGSIGEDPGPVWEDAGEEQQRTVLRGVMFRIEHPDSAPEDLHVSWLKERYANGWTYGEEKDAVKKTHPNLLPYHELPIEQRKKDALFISTVDTLGGPARALWAQLVEARRARDSVVRTLLNPTGV